MAAPSGTGSGIRLSLLLPNQPDAVITFGSPATGHDAANALGLKTPGNINVAHYALGGSTQHPLASITCTPATAPSGLPQSAELIGDPLAFTGIYALAKVDLFNLLSSGSSTLAAEIQTRRIRTSTQWRFMGRDCAVRSATGDAADRSAAECDDSGGRRDWKSSGIGVVDANGAAFWAALRLADALNTGNAHVCAFG